MASSPPPPGDRLSRRERQIVDILYRLGSASVADVVERIPDRPAYNSIRMTLSILEKKGFVKHRKDGVRYLYSATVPRKKARHSAIKHLIETFFGGSSSQAILTLLDMSPDELTKEDRKEIRKWLQDAEKRERKDS